MDHPIVLVLKSYGRQAPSSRSETVSRLHYSCDTFSGMCKQPEVSLLFQLYHHKSTHSHNNQRQLTTSRTTSNQQAPNHGDQSQHHQTTTLFAQHPAAWRSPSPSAARSSLQGSPCCPAARPTQHSAGKAPPRSHGSA